MCGIAGIYNFHSSHYVEKNILSEMVTKLKHRGPDGSGQYLRQNIGLGHTRLAILDISPAGKQPMSNQDQTIWITYNGEIYNYQSLRTSLQVKGYDFQSHSDTEVILRAYEEYGEECVRYLQGMFAFGIWDARRQLLLIARDRLGIKPLYFHKGEDKFLFASEIKALLCHPEVARELNYKAMGAYFRLMSIPTPETIYKNIYKLEPGYYLKVKERKLTKKQYWDISQTSVKK